MLRGARELAATVKVTLTEAGRLYNPSVSVVSGLSTNHLSFDYWLSNTSYDLVGGYTIRIVIFGFDY